MRRPHTLSSLILTYVLIVLVVTMGLGFGLYTRVSGRFLDEDTERQALSIAQSVAADESIRTAMAVGDPGHAVARLAEQVRAADDAAYVVVVDRAGIRHSHPNPALIGQLLDNPASALDGQTHVGIDEGTLGPSANGKAPMRAADGTLLGAVSVGILESTVSRRLWSEIPLLALYTGGALAVGVVVSFFLARRLKRMTFGLELDDLAGLLQEREAMLHGIREGVVAFDPHGRLSMINDEARRLLKLRHATIGVTLDELLPEGRLRDVLAGTDAGADQVVLTDEFLLMVNRMPVRLGGRDVGSVVTLRDRTELEGLLRELDSVTGLTDALRAQQHEFSNRLHVLSVLVGMGEHEEAMSYLDELTTTSTGQAEQLRAQITPAALAALLLAKITIAAERDILLTVTADSRLENPGPDPRALLTIVGNLVDNALDAVAETPAPRHITVRLRDDADVITIEVTDSGPGISADDTERVFADGYTTKPMRAGVRRGLGLALVHRLVTRLGGTITCAPGPGGAFTTCLPATRPAVRA